MNYFLAIDIGASSGRHILFWLKDGIIQKEEVYRFKNTMVQRNSHLCWNLEEILVHMKNGMRRCKEIGKIPKSMAIDTWGVDFVLLDKYNNIIQDSITYRDKRCENIMKEVFNNFSREKIYFKTGIQFQQFNTIYQLYAMKKEIDITKVKHFLMIPDYLMYRLTGKMINEYTNASTTQLLNIETKDWDEELLRLIGYPRSIFNKIRYPKEILGTINEDIANEIGYSMDVCICATHDTGSAYLVPEDQNSIILSSGTWSLIGVNQKYVANDKNSMRYNYTNEGGYDGGIRYLKNIAGLWILQEIQRNTGNIYSFKELSNLAQETQPFSSIINVNDPCFLKPENMMIAIDTYCTSHKLDKPKLIGEYVQCVCKSLATAYNQAILELEILTKKHYETITILGGGSQNEYLNSCIHNICQKRIIKGPIEATAYGNAICQMMTYNLFSSIKLAKESI